MARKVTFLLIIFTLICIISSTSICFAAEIKDNSKYYEATQDITCYLPYSPESPIITIPKTYYFKIVGQNETHYEIVYNNTKFYCTKESIQTYAKETELTDITTPHYSLPISEKDTQVNLYDATTFLASGSSLLKEVYFIGYYEFENNYFFYILAKLPGSAEQTYYVVRADDYSVNFSPKNINLHPNSAEFKKKEAQLSTQVAQNKLKRNIFFSVICFLCFVVVFLIYNPFKKKSPPQTRTNAYTSEDDF